METKQTVVKQIREYNKLTNFTRLIMLMKRLTKQEKEQVVNYLNLSRLTKEEKKEEVSSPNVFDHDREDTKASQLFRYLLLNPDEDEAVVRGVMGTEKVKTFERLVERLREKISFCISSEFVVLRKNTEYSKRSQELLRIGYWMNQVDIYLYVKNLPFEAYDLLSKVINSAKVYEAYTPLIQALYIKRHFLKMRQGTKGYDEITEEIKQYESCNQAYLKAWTWYETYLQFALFDGYRNGFIETFKGIITELEEECIQTKSAVVEFYYLQIKIGYLCETRCFSDAQQSALRLLELTTKRPSINTPRKVGIAYAQVSEVHLYCRHLEHSIKASKIALEHFIPNTLNSAIMEENLFWALFFSAQYNEAEKQVSRILNNINYKQSGYLDNKRKYLYASVLFANGKLAQCAKILETLKEIPQDKTGWSIGIKTLSIMRAFLQRDPEELINAKIRALRYDMKSLKATGTACRRNSLILSILYKLAKSNGDFKKIYNKRIEDFRLLEKDDPEYGWQIKSHELIIFHVWFKCMVDRRPYQVNINKEDVAILDPL